MKHLSFILFAFLFAGFVCLGQEAKIGDPLPKWQKGELDIHFINTGRGECTYQIFPDGTTFLVDASGVVTVSKELGQAPWMPDESASPGRTVANYINHFSPSVSKGHINYFLLTHHHGDHMGQLVRESPMYENGEFKLTSLCEIGTSLVMDNIFDRDWPDFSFPTEVNSGVMSNYQTFLDWTKRTNGSNVAKWAVGSSTQVVPLHDKSFDITIRNLAGNGCAAMGQEGEYASFMPTKSEFETMEKESIPNENCFSCAYMLSYGKFDFFLGGDLQSNNKDKHPYMDAETPLLNVIHKVEVAKANHHGASGSMSTDFINKLAPDVLLVGVWTNIKQPDQGPIKRVIAANPNCTIFCTYQSDMNIGRLVQKIGIEGVKDHFIDQYGHIVVRVANGGDSYMVYVLDDTDETYNIKSVHGPYVCGD